MAANDVVTMLIRAIGGGTALSLDSAKTVVDIVSSAVTAIGIIVGGIWVYFKFIKGRTYRPRVEVDLSGQWSLEGGQHFLRARVCVRNIGDSKVDVLQRGTGLRVSMLANEQPTRPGLADWTGVGVFEILSKHSWIEPDESVPDDLLLNLRVAAPTITLFEARLILKRRIGGNIAVVVRRVVPPADIAPGVNGDNATSTGEEREKADGAIDAPRA